MMGSSCNPFVQVDFNGTSQRTQTQRHPAQKDGGDSDVAADVPRFFFQMRICIYIYIYVILKSKEHLTAKHGISWNQRFSRLTNS